MWLLMDDINAVQNGKKKMFWKAQGSTRCKNKAAH